MARRRRVEPDRADEAAQQVVWARYLARVADLGGLGTEREVAERHRETGLGPETHGDFYDALSADELAELAARYPDHPASAQVHKHLALAQEAGASDIGNGAADQNRD